MKKIYQIQILILLFVILFFMASSVFAQDLTIIDQNPDNNQCAENGNCQISDLLNVIIKISTLILVLSGSLSLLFFIYGGIYFLLSSGNSDMVAKAKKILIGSIVGLIIVLGSFVIIDFIFKSLGVGTNWYKFNF